MVLYGGSTIKDFFFNSGQFYTEHGIKKTKKKNFSMIRNTTTNIPE